MGTQSPVVGPKELVSTFNDNNGSGGNMFDIKALQELSVTEMDIHTSAAGNVVATLYTKAGTYVGSENNSGAWTQIASVTVASQGQGTPTPIPGFSTPVPVASGAIQAFFVIVSSIRYTNGGSLGAVFAENSHMQFFEGKGRSGSFGSSIYSPRVWNGAIRYTTGPAAPTSPAPTPSPTATPSSGPTVTPAPTQLPVVGPKELVSTFNDNNGSGGNMFDIKALQELSVTEMDIHTSAAGNVVATLYTKAGTYVGSENNSGAWTQIASVTVASQGQGTPSPIPGFSTPAPVASGAIQAFFVIVDSIR